MSLETEFEHLVESQTERWRHSEGQPESTLLRLAILRDLVRSLHSQKSRFLATGRKDMATRLRGWEDRLHELRNQSRLEGDLLALVTGTEPIRKRTRLLPESLHSSIPKDKLDRYDRQWEQAIAAEACAMGWRFWALEAWVEITLVEEWNSKLNEQLWPSGIVLFTESSETQGPSGASLGGREFPLWRGRWLLAVHPRFKSPAEIALNLEQWPGSPPDSPSAPAYKLLYTPKVR